MATQAGIVAASYLLPNASATPRAAAVQPFVHLFLLFLPFFPSPRHEWPELRVGLPEQLAFARAASGLGSSQMRGRGGVAWRACRIAAVSPAALLDSDTGAEWTRPCWN